MRTKMAPLIALVTGLVVLIPGGARPVLAAKGVAVTGLDSIHAKRREGGKLCFADHNHYGEDTLPSRKGAEAAAIRKWQLFTAEEYGTAWGKYAKAGSKRMDCKSAGGLWTCAVTARPCR